MVYMYEQAHIRVRSEYCSKCTSVLGQDVFDCPSLDDLLDVFLNLCAGGQLGPGGPREKTVGSREGEEIEGRGLTNL
jgi:hypothetical protein